jgi:hypothetical protein
MDGLPPENRDEATYTSSPMVEITELPLLLSTRYRALLPYFLGGRSAIGGASTVSTRHFNRYRAQLMSRPVQAR